MVKYLKSKAGKIIGIIWEEKKQELIGNVAIAGIVLLVVGLTAVAWWKTHPQMKLNRNLSTCHTCGGEYYG